MPTIEQLQPASFRGIGFLVNAETKAGGKKTVTHEFVNSNKRFTEELGKLPPSFTIEAIVTDSIGLSPGIQGPQRPAVSALQRRFDLERVLDLSGLGTLIHPIYGSIEVKSTTYSVSSNQTRVGEFRFSINFEISEEKTSYIAPLPGPSLVSKLAEETRTALDNGLEAAYKDPSLPGNLTAAASKMDDVYSNVSDAVLAVKEPLLSPYAAFTSFVTNARASVFITVQRASALKESLKAMYSSALALVDTPQDLYDAWKSLLDFGFLDLEGKTNTVPRQEEESNRQRLNEHTQTTALVNLYEAAAYRNYDTDSDLDAAQETLDDAYIQLADLSLDADTRNALASLRATTRKVFNQKEQNIWRVVTISPGLSSMALIAYRYYGSLDNLDRIEGLNPGINHANFNEDILAVSRGSTV